MNIIFKSLLALAQHQGQSIVPGAAR